MDEAELCPGIRSDLEAPRFFFSMLVLAGDSQSFEQLRSDDGASDPGSHLVWFALAYVAVCSVSCFHGCHATGCCLVLTEFHPVLCLLQLLP